MKERLGADILPGREAPLRLHGALLCARANTPSSQAERGRGGSRAPVRRAVPVMDRPRPPYQSCFQPKVIVEMKRQQASFSVEIKKSRTQRQQLPPRPLFATPPDETSAFIRKAEPQPVAEPVVAPRILPSILAPVSNRSEPVEPVRSKRAVRSKAEPNPTRSVSRWSEELGEHSRHAIALGTRGTRIAEGYSSNSAGGHAASP